MLKRRPSTTMAATRGFNRSDKSSSKNKITSEEINEIKLKTQQIEQECKQLKSKTQRTIQITKERHKSINDVFSQSREKQSIKTASKNTIKMLQQTVDTLESSLEMHKQELEDLKKCENRQISKELEIEIQMNYLEQKRLKQKTSQLKEDRIRSSRVLSNLQTQIKETKTSEKAINELQDEINSLTDKYFAYTSNEMRIYLIEKLKQVHKDPNQIEKIRSDIQSDIEQEKAEIEKKKKELELIRSKEERNTKFLTNIIDENAELVRGKFRSFEEE